ncbi:MAG: stage II sporulation protein M [Ruminococcus sp.]|nr:stage II sporulation protein M [Ruminococcus sp.]
MTIHEEIPKRLIMFISLCLLTLLGVLFGTLLFIYADEDRTQALLALGDSFISDRLSLDPGALLLKVFGVGALFMITAFILGLCAVGQPFCIIVLIYRAVGFGSAMAQVYGASGKEGFREFIFLYFPEGAAALLILILAARESLSMSGIILRRLISDRGYENTKEITKLYSVKFMILLAIYGVCSLVQCIMALIYTKAFM